MRLFWILAVTTLLFFECRSTQSLIYADKRARSVSLGMDRDQVISIMGSEFLVNSSSRGANGEKNEVLAYKSSADEEYRFQFINNKLESWERVHLREYLNQPVGQPAPAQK